MRVSLVMTNGLGVRHGIVSAVERAVERETAGYTALVELGLERYAFEAVVLRYPGSFSAETVERCRQRAAQWQSGDASGSATQSE